MNDPLILTLAFAPADQAGFETMRRRHFPTERNLIPAHLTLFHHLPGSEYPLIKANLATLATPQSRFPVKVTGLRSLGRGVAYTLESPTLFALRNILARPWHAHLTPQDRQTWRPHVTIQNKVPPPEAAALLATLKATFTPFQVRADALELWHYRGGPWEQASRHDFQPWSAIASG